MALTGAPLPIWLSPMAGAGGVDLAVAVCRAGGLGALPCAMLDADTVRAQVGMVRQEADGPVNLNFFCHETLPADADAEAAWRDVLMPFYAEFGLGDVQPPTGPGRSPFDAAMCEVVESVQPEVVSFHFGLPDEALLRRVRASGAKIVSSATTVAEAKWLEARGCDAIIAQGFEAGGHRGMFLHDSIDTQVGTMALVPQVVDAVAVPVIAAGGISDARGIAAAFALGAAGVQLGTVYLRTPEALVSELHRAALGEVTDDSTALTNVFSGRPARGIVNRLMREVGPMSAAAPAFPGAGAALGELKQKAEAGGDASFSSMWAGQAAAFAETTPARALTEHLAQAALSRLEALGSS